MPEHRLVGVVVAAPPSDCVIGTAAAVHKMAERFFAIYLRSGKAPEPAIKFVDQLRDLRMLLVCFAGVDRYEFPRVLVSHVAKNLR